MPSRRDFLQLAQASLITAPFWRMLAQPARAGGLGGAKRLLIFFSPNGTIHDQLRPSGSESSFSFPAGSILEPLAGIQDQLLILDGIDFHEGDNHEGGMVAMLTNNGSSSDVGGGSSVDQFVASQLGGSYRLSSLELGVGTSAWGGNAQTRMCYAGPGDMVTPDDDPTSVFTRMYGDALEDPNEAARLAALRASVLDLAQDEIQDLHRLLGSAERVKLEAHLDALQSVQKQLTKVGSCEPSETPPTLQLYDDSAFPELARLQLDLAVEALSCGITPVATVQMAHTVCPLVMSWLGLSDGHHTLSHTDDSNTSGVQDFVTAERWFAEQFAYVVQRLMEREDPETGGSMLDSTVVLWAKELGDGRMHTCTDVPFILAGSGGGLWTPGRYLQLGGVSHSHLLVSICQALGVAADSFGDAAAGTGPLEELT